MLSTRPKKIAFLVLLSLSLTAVLLSGRLQLVSDANANIEQLLSCDISVKSDSNTETSGPVRGLNPGKFSFLNWNIYKGNGDNWTHDLDTFAKNHDLMTLQEAVLDETLAGLLQRHDFKWQMNTAFLLDSKATGVMTVSTSPAQTSCGFKTMEPLIRVPKATLVSYYKINGHEDRLLVANIHGINFTFGMDAYDQQLVELYNAIRDHRGPMIVAGDFNSWNSKRMAEVKSLIKKLSLSAIEHPVNNKTHVFDHAIDHVFYRQLELLSNKVWQVSSSDHNPISVDFRVLPATI